jgi:hypothetical protein
VRLSQEHDTSLVAHAGGAFDYRYAYARSAEAERGHHAGQDYLAFRTQRAHFLFGLCDGVGQSFFGGLAARLLGNRLLAWLAVCPTEVCDAAVIRSSLSAELRKLTERATRDVEGLRVTGDLPPLLRDVLDDKRHRGSESTFVCGRIDLPSARSGAGRLLVAWMGDSRVRVWGARGERSAELGLSVSAAPRWSSKHGPIGGEPGLFVERLTEGATAGLVSLMAYSDGLVDLDGLPQPPSSTAVRELITAAGRAPTSDDITFLEVRPHGTDAGLPPDW